MAEQSNDARPAQGNRPADNALQATPASLSAHKNWQGGAEAEDFLGLNDPPAAAAAPAAAPARTQAQAQAQPAVRSAPVAPRGAGDASWLMDTDPSATPPSQQDFVEQPQEEFFEADAELPEEPEEQYEEQEQEAYEERGALRAPAVLDASWTEPQPERNSGKRSMYIGIGAAAVLAIGAFGYLRTTRHDANGVESGTQLAQGGTASEIDGAKPAPVSNSELEVPKSSTPVVSDGGKGRMAVDRSGNTVPVAAPAVAAVASNTRPTPVPPAFVPKATPKPAPAPSATTPAVEARPTFGIPPAAVPAGASQEALLALVETLRRDVDLGQYEQAHRAFAELEQQLPPAAEDPQRKSLVAEVRRLDQQASNLEQVERAAVAARAALAEDALAKAAAQPEALPAAPTTRPNFQPDGAPPKSAETHIAGLVPLGPPPGLPVTTSVKSPAPAEPAEPVVAKALPPAPPVVEVTPPTVKIATAPGPATSVPAQPSTDGQGVRVIAARTEPLSEAGKQRPDFDGHLTAVPTAPPQPAPSASEPALAVAQAPAPAAAQEAQATPQVAATPPAPEDPNAPVHPAATAIREGSLGASDVLLPPAPINGVRVAQASDLDTVWTGESVPMDRIASAVKVMTPLVGNVRVKLKSKDVFEGRLYAVGENSVWIEGPFGRMGLGNDRIDSVERVVPDQPGAGGPVDPKAAPKSDRVMLRVDGADVFGHLVSTDAGKCKVDIDGGRQVIVDSKDVRFVEQAPKIIIKSDKPKD